jgi:eukaryotic-like serine/threonine-protein kinase
MATSSTSKSIAATVPSNPVAVVRQGPDPDAISPPPASAVGVRLGSIPANSRQELRFLQDRLALFGQVIFFLSGTFLVINGSLDAFAAGRSMTLFGRAFHAGATLVMLSLWLVCRQRRVFSQPALADLDWGATLAACVCFTLMGHSGMPPWGPFTSLLGVGHVILARAVIVPSTPRRTLWLALGCFAVITLGRTGLLPTPSSAPAEVAQLRDVIDGVLWSVAGTSLAVVASTVIYGLHEKAIKALELGHYILEQKIGEGGMGQIFRARHAMLRRPTAIKIMTGDGSEASLRRFEREVQQTARLTHPNTISVYDYGRTPDGRFYYAMELLEGKTLEELVTQSGPLPPGRVIHILLQLCGALSEAHGIGLIHRDIKPANIHVCARGGVFDVVKVLDFGLVREFKNPTGIEYSNVGAVVGTPLYFSPEAILTPEQVDARADIYGLGGVAYFLLCGVPPFSGKTLVELGWHHIHSVPIAPSRRVPESCADDLERIVLGCLEKDPERRPDSTRALAQSLRRCQDAGAWSESHAETWWQRNIPGSGTRAVAVGDDAELQARAPGAKVQIARMA